MAVGLVSDIERGVGDFRRGFIRAFFQNGGKDWVSKEQLHIDAKRGEMEGDTSFNICCEMASWPILFTFSCFMAV